MYVCILDFSHIQIPLLILTGLTPFPLANNLSFLVFPASTLFSWPKFSLPFTLFRGDVSPLNISGCSLTRNPLATFEFNIFWIFQWVKINVYYMLPLTDDRDRKLSTLFPSKYPLGDSPAELMLSSWMTSVMSPVSTSFDHFESLSH